MPRIIRALLFAVLASVLLGPCGVAVDGAAFELRLEAGDGHRAQVRFERTGDLRATIRV